MYRRGFWGHIGMGERNSSEIQYMGVPDGSAVKKICLPMQDTWVPSLIQEDPICCRTAKPKHHNYKASSLEPRSCTYWTHALQLLKPSTLEPMLHNKRSHHNEKPAQGNEEWLPLAKTGEGPLLAAKTQHGHT